MEGEGDCPGPLRCVPCGGTGGAGGGVVVCGSCGTENREGRKFCSACGSALALVCPTCGAANDPADRFCGDCGATLAEGLRPTSAAAGLIVPSAERRLVTVLFADLVGFTTHSEARDAEEGRELLSGYFETCSRLVSLYGGSIAKFIGDAVMAVWGTPVAREDDVERAVRTALDQVDAVAALGEANGIPELRARAGVLTGEAAVTLGAEGQGMVAGDMVNTASRIQSAASPGAVYVGDATRRATEAAIVYEDAGTHELKGKAEPVGLWRAVRVIGGRGGALKSAGLEPPFVGRDRARPPWSPWSASAASGSPDWPGSSSSTSTACRTPCSGTAAGACPTAKGSRTGRSPRWSGCGPASSRRRTHRRRCRSCTRASSSISRTQRSASGSNPAWRTSWAWRSEPPGTARTCSARGGCSSNG